MAKDYAILHPSEKGQILITKEFDTEKELFEITLWFPLKGASGKASFKIEDENEADAVFEKLRDFETVKENLNLILNQDFL
jgi:hypothetical protein